MATTAAMVIRMVPGMTILMAETLTIPPTRMEVATRAGTTTHMVLLITIHMVHRMTTRTGHPTLTEATTTVVTATLMGHPAIRMVPPTDVTMMTTPSDPPIIVVTITLVPPTDVTTIPMAPPTTHMGRPTTATTMVPQITTRTGCPTRATVLVTAASMAHPTMTPIVHPTPLVATS